MALLFDWNPLLLNNEYIYIYIYISWMACSAKLSVVENVKNDPSSNPGQGYLHFISGLETLGKVWIQIFFHLLV